MKDKVEQFQAVEELIQMAYETGAIYDPLTEFELDLAASPLRQGAIAERFQSRLFNKLAPRVMEMRLQGPPPATFPVPPVNQRVVIGTVIPTGEALPIGYPALNRHTLICGPSGCGKSTLEAIMINDLMTGSDTITMAYHDYKHEAPRLINHFPDDVIILPPDQELVNHIDPTGTADQFGWSVMAEIAKSQISHPATWPEAAEVLVQIHRGLKPGDPPPSLIDCCNIFRKLAENGRPKFYSVYRDFSELCSVLGRTAFIRRAPRLDGIARIIVHDHAGIPQKLRSLFAALRFMRMQAEAAQDGRAGDRLRHIIFQDEGQEVFSKELSQLAGSGYIAPVKRFLTQGRSTGTGIVVSVVSLLNTDEIVLSNTATVIVFRCPDPTEARKAAELLGNAQLVAEIPHLPDRIAYVRSAGFSGPVKIRVPEFDLGPYPSDALVQQQRAKKLAAPMAQTEYTPDHPEDLAKLDYLSLLGERPQQQVTITIPKVTEDVRSRFLADHQKFLRELHNHPADAVTAHYRRLQWSVGKANRIKNQLLEMSLIRVERQSSANGRPIEILMLTEAGKELLNENTN